MAAGASIEAIAREVGRDPSTVSYWARKHGLTSAHAPRHAARGSIDGELLAEVVACELSVRDMAEVFERSPTTIRHWLRRHRLSSGPAKRRAAVAAADASNYPA
ncbi:MAG: helix-turn-helix domain-containing protein [Solirubrobacteraceae bacterium]